MGIFNIELDKKIIFEHNKWLCNILIVYHVSSAFKWTVNATITALIAMMISFKWDYNSNYIAVKLDLYISN